MADKQARAMYLLRHAKSDRPTLVEDIGRPLAGRGRRDAKAVAAVLARKTAPELVLCSPSLRTRQTWQLARQGITSSPKVRFEALIYGADWKELLDLLRKTPVDVRTIMVIGHEPTMSELAVQLAGPGGNRTALRQLSIKFPTSGLATLEPATSWSDLGPGGAKLTRFDVPRG